MPRRSSDVAADANAGSDASGRRRARAGSGASGSSDDGPRIGARGRRVLAAVAVLALVATAGCVGQFGSGIPEEELAADADYEWNASADTEVRLVEHGFLGGAEYRVVYSGNETELTLSTQGFTRSHSVDIRAVQFRYAENGTVVGHEAIDVSQSARQTTVRLPDAEGQFAFSGERRSQELQLQTVDEGSVAVVLPENHRVGDLLLSDVVPRSYESDTIDGRSAVRWEDLDAGETLLVRHYRDRDWYLFYGLLTALSVVAVLGYAYFKLQIRQIQQRREEYGLDVDVEDDDGRRPPPGMG